MRNLNFLFSEAKRTYHNKLLYLVKVQRNSAIAERDFHFKSKSTLTSAIKFTKHDANSAFLDNKRVINLLKES